MSREELRMAAIACLGKAFKGEEVPQHIVAAAVSVVLSPTA